MQNPADRRQILFDEALIKVFKTKKTTYFKINALLSGHVKPLEEIS